MRFDNMSFTVCVFNSQLPQKVSDMLRFPCSADESPPYGQYFCTLAGQIPFIIWLDLSQTFIFKGESKTLFLPPQKAKPPGCRAAEDRRQKQPQRYRKADTEQKEPAGISVVHSDSFPYKQPRKEKRNQWQCLPQWLTHCRPKQIEFGQ